LHTEVLSLQRVAVDESDSPPESVTETAPGGFGVADGRRIVADLPQSRREQRIETNHGVPQ
jgi:hypothetical protein